MLRTYVWKLGHKNDAGVSVTKEWSLFPPLGLNTLGAEQGMGIFF